MELLYLWKAICNLGLRDQVKGVLKMSNFTDNFLLVGIPIPIG